MSIPVPKSKVMLKPRYAVIYDIIQRKEGNIHISKTEKVYSAIFGLKNCLHNELFFNIVADNVSVD